MNEASPIPAGEDPTSETEVPPQDLGPVKGDLTKGPILRTLLLFSLPMLLSNVLQTLNGSVNAIWVGRLIGESALAATANANVIMFLLYATVFGFGMATTVRVGQHFGARDIDAARKTFGSGLGFCFALSLIVAVAGGIYAPALLHTLGTPDASKAEALSYLRVIFVTIPLGGINMMVSMAMRGAGDSKTPMNAMILTVAIDTVLNPVLIMGLGPIPELGIAGSALATACANLVGMTFQIWRIYRQDLPMRLRGAELGYVVPQGSELRYIVTKGLPMGAQMLLVSSAGLIMVGLVNREGLNAAAAYGASLQLWNYLQMPAFAISTAVSAMVAQSLGAGDHSRVGKVTLVGMGTNLVMSIALAALIVGFDRPLLALFLGGNSPALPVAEHIQLICTTSFVIVSITMILTGTMRAYGAVVAPLVIMFLGLYPGRLGFYFLARPMIDSEAVWWAYPVGSVLTVALTLAYYRFGKWRDAFRM
ncbi:MATE family efflux transporter [Novosphingobium mangrovi (ex Huang et al. 2023)]|uniref:MATE family efflux transporter n=1 Tax=Novosphingobium mangrovi (ex Huang et al. 2023) TaxID=2976432 RepID=A0ABT2I4H7_9SPHN|nr:MATE family efflux transporter [Novosphingobium mangrovi (ex Huang et al. 2023)]MCT2399707.1 MATE family efflux transporter [Novosphingobium mangrovi (ex Huang et al. 2023)]